MSPVKSCYFCDMKNVIIEKLRSYVDTDVFLYPKGTLILWTLSRTARNVKKGP